MQTDNQQSDDSAESEDTSTVTFDAWMEDYDNRSWFWSMLLVLIVGAIVLTTYLLRGDDSAPVEDDEDTVGAEAEDQEDDNAEAQDLEGRFDVSARENNSPADDDGTSDDDAAEPVYVEDTVFGEHRSWKETDEPQPRLALVHEQSIIILDAFTFESIETIEVDFEFGGSIDRNAVNDNRHVMLTSTDDEEQKMLIDVGVWSVPKTAEDSDDDAEENDDGLRNYVSQPYVYSADEVDEALEVIENSGYTTGQFDDSYSWLFEEEDSVTLIRNGEEEFMQRAGVDASDVLVAGLD